MVWWCIVLFWYKNRVADVVVIFIQEMPVYVAMFLYVSMHVNVAAKSYLAKYNMLLQSYGFFSISHVLTLDFVNFITARK